MARCLKKFSRSAKSSERTFSRTECFLDLTDGGESLKPFLTRCPRLFILKAFTKSYGMAGVRLGYGLCADASLLHGMSETVPPWNVSTLAPGGGRRGAGGDGIS